MRKEDQACVAREGLWKLARNAYSLPLFETEMEEIFGFDVIYAWPPS